MPARLIPTPKMTASDGLLDPTVELTVGQAAELCHVRSGMIRRRLGAGLFPNCHRALGDGHHRWMIPIGDLVGAGLLDRALVADPEAGALAEAKEADAVLLARLQGEVAGLREAYEARGKTIEAQEHALAAYRALLGDLGAVA